MPQKESRICAAATVSTPPATKKAPHLAMKYFVSSNLLLDDLATFVVPAYFAYAVRKLQFAAMIASYHARHFQLEVRTALVATGFGRFSKRYCHGPTSFSVMTAPVVIRAC